MQNTETNVLFLILSWEHSTHAKCYHITLYQYHDPSLTIFMMPKSSFFKLLISSSSLLISPTSDFNASFSFSIWMNWGDLTDSFSTSVFMVTAGRCWIYSYFKIVRICHEICRIGFVFGLSLQIIDLVYAHAVII